MQLYQVHIILSSWCNDTRTGLWSLWYNVTMQYVWMSYAAIALTKRILGIVGLFSLDYPAFGLPD